MLLANLFSNLPSGVLLAVAACVAILLAVRLFSRRETPLDPGRRQAIKLAGDCKASGLDFLAPLLEDFAVGDQASLLHRLRSLAEDVRDDGQRRALFDRLFETQLAQRMKDPATRQQIVGAMNGLDASHAALLAELLKHVDAARAATPATP